nr:hypothetical protein [Prevotella sp.]
TDTESMFSGCTSLQRIYFKYGSWSNLNEENSDNMFKDCVSLVGARGTKYNSNHIDGSYACYDMGIGRPGYFSWSPMPIEKYFPDENFSEYMKGFDINKDDSLSAKEIEEVYEVDVPNLGILDFTGIEQLYNLEGLNCSQNGIKTISLWMNPHLVIVDCSQNNINGNNMDSFIKNLPTVEGEDRNIIVFNNSDSNYPDTNEMTKTQVANAQLKGWTVKLYDEQAKDFAETQGYVFINTEHFPNANFRNFLLEQGYRCTGVLTEEDVMETYELDLYNQGISNLKGIELFTELEALTCDINNLSTIDLSENTKLTYLSCSENHISGTYMDNLISTLPKVTNGTFFVYDGRDGKSEANEMTPEQVSEVNNKGWKVRLYDLSGKEVETQGFWLINKKRFPDANFRQFLLEYGFQCTGAVTTKDVSDTPSLSMSKEGISDLTGIEYFTEIEELSFHYNNVKTVDLSKNTKLYLVDCFKNQMSGHDMDEFIENLPTVEEGVLNIYDPRADATYPERNKITESQAKKAKAKGWTLWAYDLQARDWVEYGGMPVPTAISEMPSAGEQESRWYSPDGRLVEHPRKGSLYIVDGKKVIKQ